MCHRGKYFASQVCWLLIILFICLIGVVIPPSQSVEVIRSAESGLPSNSPSDPLILSHLADIHISHDDSDNVRLFQRALGQSVRYGATIVFTTGDLANNWKGLFSELGFGDQVEQDFKAYNDSTSLLPRNVVYLDAAGNHAEYGVPSRDTDTHNLHKYRHSHNQTTNFQTLWASTFPIGNFSFLILNPFLYPRPHAKLGFWIRPTSEILDRIESELLTPFTGYRIILTHFPIRCWFDDVKSTNGKSIRDLIKESQALLVLTGHLHPSEAWIQHFGGVIEFVGTDLVWHETFALITVDNGRAAYHRFRVDDPPLALLTFPIAKEQLSNSVDFRMQTSEIRAIVFTNETLEIKVSGAVSGVLNKTRQLRTGWLYTLPFTLPNGEHHLTFSGDWDHEVDFVIGDSVQLGREKIYGYPNFVYTAIIGGFVIWCIEAIIVFPVGQISITKRVEAWIHEGIGGPFWVFAILLGFLSVRHRICGLPLCIRIFLIVLVIWPIALPIAGMAVGDNHGFVWSYGYVLGSARFFDAWGTLFGAFYIVLILLPLLFLASGLTVKPVFGVDIAFGCLGGLMMVVGAAVLLYQAVGTIGTVFSPAYVILPLILIISLIVWNRRRKDLQDSDYWTSSVGS
jgi:hypothetical protein